MQQGEPMPKAPKGFACCRTTVARDAQMSHLVRRGPFGTPGPTLCGLTRFDQRDPETNEVVRHADIPGWSIDGGTWGPGYKQERCDECWRLAEVVGCLTLVDGPPVSQAEVERDEIRALVAHIRLYPGRWFKLSEVTLGARLRLWVVADSAQDIELVRDDEHTYVRAVTVPPRPRWWWRRS